MNMCGKYGCSKCAGKGWFCKYISASDAEYTRVERERRDQEAALKIALKKERELARAQLFRESEILLRNRSKQRTIRYYTYMKLSDDQLKEFSNKMFTKYEDVFRRLAAE